MIQINETAKIVGDVTAGGVTIASLLGYLPALAALISIIYGCLRIYEWFDKRRNK